MAGTLTVDTIQSDSSYASRINVTSNVAFSSPVTFNTPANFAGGMQIGGQDATFGGMRNRIINGDMRIDQRNAGASVNANSSTAPYVTDRFNINVGGSSSVIACQQITDAPANFINSLRLTVSTAATPSSSQFLFVRQIIEGVNIADLGWGTASAQPLTASFWVKASLTGTYASFAINSSETRSYVGTFSVSASNTWEYKTVTIPGDTTGTWLTNNSNGIRFGFDLGSGSNFNGTANAWQPGWEQRTSSTVNFCQTVGATFQVTGVQLEKGSSATAFEYRQFGQEFALCQRYYEEQFLQWATAWSAGMNNYSGTLKVTKRVTPTTTAVYASGTNDKTGTVGYVRNTTNSADIVVNSLVAESPNNFSIDYSTGSASARNMRAYVTFSSEL
jgi:hypothetical protein